MKKGSFSERYGPKHVDLMYEDAPEQVRVGLREVLAKCGYSVPSSQRSVICEALRKRPDSSNWSEYPNVDQEVSDLLDGLKWYEFYDLCANLAGRVSTQVPVSDGETIKYAKYEKFEKELNALFQEEGIGYRMVKGQIEKVGSDEFDQAVAEASGQLGNPRFEAPLRQLKKALAFRNGMPPDCPNAVKEAVNAVEAVWQVVASRQGTALPSILSSLDPPLPSGLKKLYDGLYGYGSAVQGGRHGGVGGPIPTAQEAEFIIHTAAAAISYAIKAHVDLS